MPTPLPERAVRFAVEVPDWTPEAAIVYLQILPFIDWDVGVHIPMARNRDGTWSATATLAEGALVQYVYDIWDETEWARFKDAREATATGVPIERRVLHVTPELEQVRDIVGGWRSLEGRQATGEISGIVVDPAGEPVVDSEVTVAGIHTASDWDGRFRVEVAPGLQRVTAYRPDGAHTTAGAEVEVVAGRVSEVRLQVAETAEVPVTLSVELPPDTPAGAEIRVVGSALQFGASTGGLNTPPLMASSIRLPALTRTADGRAEGTFILRAGMHIQYFYTLTSDSAGREWELDPPRRNIRTLRVPTLPVTRGERVDGWWNPDWPKVTFRVRVPPNTPNDIPIALEMGPHHWMTRVGPRTWEMTLSNISDTEYRYRYRLGGDSKGVDGTPGLTDGGLRVATAGRFDVVFEDEISRWENLPAVSTAPAGSRATIVLAVSVPSDTPEDASIGVRLEGGPYVPMTQETGNPWLVRGQIEAAVGLPVRYRVEGPQGAGPWRDFTPLFEGQTLNDWVTAWTSGGASPAAARPGYLAGYYPPDFWSPEFLSLSESTFSRIVRHNGNLVAVSSVWSYGSIKPSPVVEPRPVEAGSVRTPRQDAIDQIAVAHRNGLQVLLAPQFNMEMSPGGIDALNNNSTQWWDEWLREAERVWMWNAQLASETGAEMLLLPGFVFHVFARPWFFESEEAFHQFNRTLAALVEQVKRVYRGRILISGGVGESDVPGMADLIGVTTYDTGHPDLPATASVSEWRIAYDSLFKDKLDPIHERWGKPVFFYTIHLPPHPDDTEPGGQSLQARRLEGLMQALESRPWVEGSLSWSYEMVDAPLANGDGLRGRLAEAVLAKYYGRFTGKE